MLISILTIIITTVACIFAGFTYCSSKNLEATAKDLKEITTQLVAYSDKLETYSSNMLYIQEQQQLRRTEVVIDNFCKLLRWLDDNKGSFIYKNPSPNQITSLSIGLRNVLARAYELPSESILYKKALPLMERLRSFFDSSGKLSYIGAPPLPATYVNALLNLRNTNPSSEEREHFKQIDDILNGNTDPFDFVREDARYRAKQLITHPRLLIQLEKGEQG